MQNIIFVRVLGYTSNILTYGEEFSYKYITSDFLEHFACDKMWLRSRVSSETSFVSKQPKLEPKLV